MNLGNKLIDSALRKDIYATILFITFMSLDGFKLFSSLFLERYPRQRLPEACRKKNVHKKEHLTPFIRERRPRKPTEKTSFNIIPI